MAYQWSRELARRLSLSEPDKVRYIVHKTSFASGVERFPASTLPSRLQQRLGTETPSSWNT
jgi:hypothetical protein